jgi:hypothetical protein
MASAGTATMRSTLSARSPVELSVSRRTTSIRADSDESAPGRAAHVDNRQHVAAEVDPHRHAVKRDFQMRSSSVTNLRTA